MFTTIGIVAIPSRARFVNVFAGVEQTELGSQITLPSLVWLRAEQVVMAVPGTTIIGVVDATVPGNPGYLRVIVPTNATHLGLFVDRGRGGGAPIQANITWELEL